MVASPPTERLDDIPVAPHRLVGQIPIFDGMMSDAVEFCLQALEDGRGAKVATANLDFLALASRDPVLREDLRRSDLVVADGQPVALLARLAGARRAARVPGVDLVAELCRHGAKRGGLRVALYGGAEDVTQRAATWIQTTYPGVEVSLALSPPYRELTVEERERDARRIAHADPDLVLVALGCPRQERMIAEHHTAAARAVWIGVGGTFDFFAGERRRAPQWAQRYGLEWAIRLGQEPRRLWRRYLLRDIPTLASLTPRVLARAWRERASTRR